MKMGKSEAQAVWGASPAGSIYSKDLAPGTRDFFEKSLRARNDYEIPWLFEVVPFALFKDKKVIELGCGAGFDAYELCRAGADYTGIDITPQNIERTRTHLGFYGFVPKVQEADAEHLPFEDAQFDAAFSNGVLHHTPDMAQSFREANRVLRPGGVFYVILYHKHSIFYWLTLWLFDHLLGGGFRKRTFAERIGKIEYTTSDEIPLVNVYSKTELRKILRDAGFQVESVCVRKLMKEDMPNIPVLRRLWKRIPQKMYDAAGKRFGRYVIAKGVKD